MVLVGGKRGRIGEENTRVTYIITKVCRPPSPPLHLLFLSCRASIFLVMVLSFSIWPTPPSPPSSFSTYSMRDVTTCHPSSPLFQLQSPSSLSFPPSIRPPLLLPYPGFISTIDRKNLLSHTHYVPLSDSLQSEQLGKKRDGPSVCWFMQSVCYIYENIHPRITIPISNPSLAFQVPFLSSYSLKNQSYLPI